MYKEHSHCRACGYAFRGASGIKSDVKESLIEVLDLGLQPLANDFCKEGQEQSGYAPLKVLFCPRCSLGQLSVVVNPDVLYRHYSYVTSPSHMMREHFKQLISDIMVEAPDAETFLEIGSNDGKLLAMIKDGAGKTVLGIDPADNLFKASLDRGVPAITEMFTSKLAEELASRFDVIIARHVFCHIDDWQDFVKGLEAVTHGDSLICIEVPYAGDTLHKCEFDTIYHEHLSYLTIKSVEALIAKTELKLHRIIRYAIHGGAILLMLKKKTANLLAGAQFRENITAADWQAFAAKADGQIRSLRAMVDELRGGGKSVAALGASAKSTVWINSCGFTRKQISFIADTTPQKLYTKSPGSNIPIVDEGAIIRELPDYVIMFAWNYEAEVLEKFKLARDKGVKFIVPVPEIKVV